MYTGSVVVWCLRNSAGVGGGVSAVGAGAGAGAWDGSGMGEGEGRTGLDVPVAQAAHLLRHPPMRA